MRKIKRMIAKWMLPIGCLGLLMLTGCIENDEGCLDVAATNYNVGADKACPDCCQYPRLRLNLSNRYDTQTLSLNQPFPLNGKTARITSLRMYFSDVSLEDSQGRILTVEDELEIGGQTLKDDYAIFTFGSSSLTIGTFRQDADQVNQLQLQIGVDDLPQAFPPDSFPDNHPLSPLADTMYDYSSMQYIDFKMEIVPDTLVADTPRLALTFGQPIELQIPLTQTLLRGEDVEIPLKIDYQIWWSGVDFQLDAPALIEQKLRDNASGAFSFGE